MTAGDIYAALQGLGARVVRGGEQGLPPPTLGYTLARDGDSQRCELLIRAYLKEQCDSVFTAAREKLLGLGFSLDHLSEGAQKDTGVFTLKAVLIKRDALALLAGGVPVGGVLDCRIVRSHPLPAVALDGTARPLPGETRLRLTLHDLPEDAGQGNLGTQGAVVDVSGQSYRAYRLRDEGMGKKRGQEYLLLPPEEGGI